MVETAMGQMDNLWRRDLGAAALRPCASVNFDAAADLVEDAAAPLLTWVKARRGLEVAQVPIDRDRARGRLAHVADAVHELPRHHAHDHRTRPSDGRLRRAASSSAPARRQHSPLPKTPGGHLMARRRSICAPARASAEARASWTPHRLTTSRSQASSYISLLPPRGALAMESLLPQARAAES